VHESYLLIDTAGMRKTRRVDDSIEFFSVKRAEASIARCDLTILVLDAESGITEQDKKIADQIVAERKACIVIVNKWDLMDEAVRYVAAQLQQKIPTAILNRTLQDAVERRQPVSSRGHRLKFFYATQVNEAPPTFLLFVNRDELFSAQYKKYLADQMRRAFGYEGCPMVLVPKPRPKTIEPVRKFKPRSRKKQPGSKARRAVA